MCLARRKKLDEAERYVLLPNITTDENKHEFIVKGSFILNVGVSPVAYLLLHLKEIKGILTLQASST